MNSELEERWKEVAAINLKYYTAKCLQRIQNAMIHPHQDRGFTDQGLNLVFPKYEPEELLTTPWRSLWHYNTLLPRRDGHYVSTVLSYCTVTLVMLL